VLDVGTLLRLVLLPIAHVRGVCVSSMLAADGPQSCCVFSSLEEGRQRLAGDRGGGKGIMDLSSKQSTITCHAVLLPWVVLSRRGGGPGVKSAVLCPVQWNGGCVDINK